MIDRLNYKIVLIGKSVNAFNQVMNKSPKFLRAMQNTQVFGKSLVMDG